MLKLNKSALVLGCVFFYLFAKAEDCSRMLTDDQVVFIAEKELARLKKASYKNKNVSIYRYECDYVYREDSLPETPGKWFEIVIDQFGVVKEFVYGR